MPAEHNFKLIAIRILPDCADHIRKCLKKDVFYYLNNDYRISEDGMTINQASKNIKPLNPNFFSIDNGTSASKPTVNLSAIVGMNGDGKSSIVEVFLRLINNLSKKIEFGDHQQLIHIVGLKAECYYMLDGVFYVIKECDDSNIVVSKYEQDGNVYKMQTRKLHNSELHDKFFYTLVSNYSHYAYNVADFSDEFEKDKNNEENCWLNRIFNKNDGYQVPLSLHPYREWGNIDINNEKELSLQRLLAVFIQNYGTTKGLVNGKTPDVLFLKDIGYSKLQKYTLKRFRENNDSSEHLLGKYIDYVRHSLTNTNAIENEKKIKMFFSFLSDLYNEYIEKDNELYKKYIRWAYPDREHTTGSSDMSILISLLHDILHSDIVDDSISHHDILNKWKAYKVLNLRQILHLFYVKSIVTEINNIDKEFHISTDEFFLDYGKMSDNLKCRHYILYKTCKIFETYKNYGRPEELLFSMIEASIEDPQITKLSFPYTAIEHAFKQLKHDIEQKSHVIIKLLQTYNHLNKLESRKQIYPTANPSAEIRFDTLNSKFHDEYYDINNMPPAIYKWDIFFKIENQDKPIPFSSFSSGEKQKLFNISSIIYQLNNINTVSDGIKYNAVNIILEELELYFHPEWQRTFVYDLLEMISNANIPNIKSINILFVTHSPFILSNIPQTNILYLKNGENHSNSIGINPFGANIGDIFNQSFFLQHGFMGEFAKYKIKNIISFLNHETRNSDIDINDVRSTIDLVGDPILRDSLNSSYYDYINQTSPDFEKKERIKLLEAEIDKLKMELKNEKN